MGSPTCAGFRIPLLVLRHQLASNISYFIEQAGFKPYQCQSSVSIAFSARKAVRLPLRFGSFPRCVELEEIMAAKKATDLLMTNIDPANTPSVIGGIFSKLKACVGDVVIVKFYIFILMVRHFQCRSFNMPGL